MSVWGCEYWTGCCIRPINSAISGGSVETLISNKSGCIGELLPDIIIWQPTLSNDGALTSRTYTLYKEYLDYLLSITPTVVVVLQTASIDIASDNTTFEQFQTRKNVARMLCAESGIPIIDIDAYLKEKYGKIMPTSVMPDKIHLSNEAEIDISQVFVAAFL